MVRDTHPTGCETYDFLEIGPFEWLPAGIHKALNALIPAAGRAEEIGRLPRAVCRSFAWFMYWAVEEI